MKATILPFKGVHAYCNYWDKKVLTVTGRYLEILNNLREYWNYVLPRGDTESNIADYGLPVPLSYQEAMDRKFFLNTALYNNVYQQLMPYLAQLEKLSEGIIPKEVIKPTDLEIGVFSFDRAAMALEEVPALYSVKEDKFYPIDEKAIEIRGKNGEHLSECSIIKKFSSEKECRLRYKVMPSGVECVMVQEEEENVKMFTSANKKSFLRKEKAPRPNRMVRFFVLTGANAGLETYWAGLTAIIAATFLESKGYAVKITGVVGIEDSGMNMESTIQEGARFHMIDLKAYDETMDSLSLLYILADMSFFRVRIFEYFVAQQWQYQDTPNSQLGRMAGFDTFKAALSEEIKKRNITEEKDVLYYYFGGNQCTSIEAAKRDLIRIICDAENTNKEMLIKLGYEFPPPVPSSGRKVGDIDCP